MSTTRSVLQLLLGLALFGASIALLVRAGFGLDPWNVLHHGVALQTHVSLGLVVIAASVVVLALWLPLKQRPGVGTVANVVLVGVALDTTLTHLPTPSEMWQRVLLLVMAVVGNGVATGLYIGAGLGPGPRDGLMTGLANRGLSIRVARTSVEVIVLGIGWVLGGAVGIGTVVYALAIGPLAQTFIPLFAVHRARREPCCD